MTAKTVETPSELMPMIRKIEEAIKRRVAIGTKISYLKLQSEMMSRFENQRAIDYVRKSIYKYQNVLICFAFVQAIISMIKRDEFDHFEGRKLLARKK